MALTREQAEEVLESVTHWLSNPNIVGLDIGYKTKKGKTTKTLAIVVDVIEKKPKNKLTDDDILIPARVKVDVAQVRRGELELESETLPTDVVEVGEIVDEEELLLPVEDFIVDEDLNTKKRPCPGGYFVQTAGLTSRGTLGANFVYKGKYRLVSNNHVIAKNGSVGKVIHQPTPPGVGNDLVKVTSYITIKYYSNSNQPNPVYNTQDVAWADATKTKCSPKIEFLGTPKGLRNPKNGERIRKVGAKTGKVLSANINSLTYRYKSKSTSLNMYSWWKNGIKLDAYISAGGDSGSMYVGDDNYIVAIHRAGSKKNNRSIGAPL